MSPCAVLEQRVPVLHSPGASTHFLGDTRSGCPSKLLNFPSVGPMQAGQARPAAADRPTPFVSLSLDCRHFTSLLTTCLGHSDIEVTVAFP